MVNVNVGWIKKWLDGKDGNKTSIIVGLIHG